MTAAALGFARIDLATAPARRDPVAVPLAARRRPAGRGPFAPRRPSGPKRPRHIRITVKLAALAVLFCAVPAILYGEFRQSDDEKNALLLLGAREQGRLIAQALKPHLAAKSGPTAALPDALSQFAGEGLRIKVLFRPAGASDPNAFFYIAASPPVPPELLEDERNRLAERGILSGLAASCALDLPSALRHRRRTGEEEVITSITPVLNAAGCWAVVAAYDSGPLAESSLGRPYWQTPEVRVAAAIYVASALLILWMFLRVSQSLSRFSRVAAEIRAGRSGGSFSELNTVPELANVAGEIDRMVETLGKLSRAVENSPAAVLVADRAGRIEYVNPAFTALTGYAEHELVGRTCRSLRTPDTPLAQAMELLRSVARGDTWRGEIRSRAKSGEPYWALVSVAASPGADGRPAHIVAVLDDISDRKHADRQSKLLMAELNHRVKNALATVRSVATQTLDRATSLDEFRAAFEGRLAVLAKAHDLLTQSKWQGADVRAAAERALGPFLCGHSAAVHMQGPPVHLSPKLALALSLALHELATNAVKYGALSVPEGKIAIAWSLEQGAAGQTLRLIWTENGGPMVGPAARPGFGTRLIERGLSYDFDGEAAIEFRPEGVRCTILLPWPGADESDASAAIA